MVLLDTRVFSCYSKTGQAIKRQPVPDTRFGRSAVTIELLPLGIDPSVRVSVETTKKKGGAIC